MAKNASFFSSDPEQNNHNCAVSGCPHAGLYPAPRSKAHLHDYIWLCLEHVRAYNAGWDFLAGLSEPEIETFIRESTVWERPTFKTGVNPQTEAFVRKRARQQFREDAWQTKNEPRTSFKAGEDEALAVLGLVRPITFSHIKARYRSLAKRHHPDANGGSREAVEKIKAINIAFATLAALYDPHKKNDQDRR